MENHTSHPAWIYILVEPKRGHRVRTIASIGMDLQPRQKGRIFGEARIMAILDSYRVQNAFPGVATKPDAIYLLVRLPEYHAGLSVIEGRDLGLFLGDDIDLGGRVAALLDQAEAEYELDREKVAPRDDASGRRLGHSATEPFGSQQSGALSDLNFGDVRFPVPGVVRMELVDADRQELKLTLSTLTQEVVPVLSAMSGIQSLIGRSANESVQILEISQNSPIRVSMQGVGDAWEKVRDDVVPWRRQHKKALAELDVKAREAEVEIKRAQVAYSDSQSQRELAEAERLRAQAQQIQIEVEQKKLELQKQKIDFALELARKIEPHASSVEQITLVTQLLPHLETLMFTRLEIIPDNRATDREP